ncbi:hypothetical protein Vretimale_2523 [Volvox reticuliferus]|uniref:Uncharacterized protein n=1 Tax=Volvox reticuliferus TaxID=1737510 RepID=A0A8J4CAJ5_9CHLO|nr:hypothetical protein Vretifemale_4730 [Volvox reticuliferus]GIL96707.1 hypothetical protein Vretimale_2523 [Volvox reticuliferus]
MATDILRMDGNQYAPPYGTCFGYGPYHGYDPYARQTMHMQPQRGPSFHNRQSYGYSGGYGRPHHTFRSANAGHGSSKRRFDSTNQAPQGQPSLHQLRAVNLKKTRRHFQGSWEAPESTPRIAPRAPDNRHGYLLSVGSGTLPSNSPGFLHTLTPSAIPGSEQQLWKNSYGTADKEAVQLGAAAGLDFLGSFFDDSLSLDIDDDFDMLPRNGDSENKGGVGADAPDADQPPLTYDEEASYPPQAKRKLASQAAYIAQLEEQQLTLKERIFLLEQELAEARRQRAASPSGHSDGVDDASDEDRATSSAD